MPARRSTASSGGSIRNGADRVIIEGYAALFGVADTEGDVIHVGAFRDSIVARLSLPMLLRHDPRLVAGAWHELREDSRGLHVRGAITAEAPAGFLAARFVNAGMDGLSIGFRTRAQRMRPGGRDLYDIDLIEISIVPVPMAPRARLIRAPNQDVARLIRAHS